ncbi:MAG: CPBP family intramembrane metalloprotease [Phycisphaerales bacterium]|nr:CPBP family intramembrane metalloprotease [Phycisphaerales bacterium]
MGVPLSPSKVALRAPATEVGGSFSERVERLKEMPLRDALAQIGAVWPQVVVLLAIGVVVFLALAGVLRRGGLSKAAARDVKPFPSPMWLFVGVVVFLAQALAAESIAKIPSLVGDEVGSLRYNAVRLALSAVAAGGVGLGMLVLMRKSAPDAGLRIGGLDPLVGLGCFILALPLVQVASMGAEWLYQEIYSASPPRIAHDTLAQIVAHRDDRTVWLLVAAVVIGAPIVEELVFRVGVQSAILKVTGSPWGAVLGASLLFTLIHWGVVPPEGRFALAQIFVLSLSMGIAYERTRKLGVPIVMHVCFNAMTVALAMWGASEPA